MESNQSVLDLQLAVSCTDKQEDSPQCQDETRHSEQPVHASEAGRNSSPSSGSSLDSDDDTDACEIEMPEVVQTATWDPQE